MCSLCSNIHVSGQFRKKSTFLEILLTLPEYQKPVKLAIQNSGLNVTPQQEKMAIIIPLPRATREHREQLMKKADVLLNQSIKNLNAVSDVRQGRSQQGWGLRPQTPS